jgi:hypothetical protein
LMGPGDAADRAFRTVHRGCRNFDMDQRAILALAEHLFVTDGLAATRALIHFQGFVVSLRRHDLHARANRLCSGIAVELLCRAVP